MVTRTPPNKALQLSAGPELGAARPRAGFARGDFVLARASWYKRLRPQLKAKDVRQTQNEPRHHPLVHSIATGTFASWRRSTSSGTP